MADITISDLELAPALADDMVLPVENSTDTYAATLAMLRRLLNKTFVEEEDADFNDLTDDGFYQCTGTPTNSPVAGAINWTLQVSTQGGVTVQRAFSLDDDFANLYIRRWNGVTWTTWLEEGGGALTGKANVDLDNLSVTGNSKFQTPITGGASTITSSNLTASRALVSDANGKVAASSITSTKLGYLTDVTSNIQAQLNGKQASIAGAASTITSSNLTASRALISDANGKVAVSSITSTKLGYLTDVTSNIQAQLNGKVSSASPALTGTPTAPTAASTVNNTQIATTAYVVAHRCTTAATTTSSASIYKPAVVVENYKNGDDWYRVWSDGWVEQGGLGSMTVAVTFLKAFSDTKYTVLTQMLHSTVNTYYNQIVYDNYSKTSFTSNINGGNSTVKFKWYACGY